MTRFEEKEKTSETSLKMSLPTILQGVTRLSTSAGNFRLWERQLKVKTRDITGLELSYLDTWSRSSSNSESVDQLIQSMIFWSIDDSLQLAIDLDASAPRIFHQLKQICSPDNGDSHSTSPPQSLPCENVLPSENIIP